MSNGDNHPGAVLVFRNDQFEAATRADVHHNANAYVLIPGAHTDTTDASFVRVSKRILAVDPNADVYCVDWARWSKFKYAKMSKAQWLMAALGVVAGVDTSDCAFDSGTFVGKCEYGPVIIVNAAVLATLMSANISAVEQTLYIPQVAERAFEILFTEDSWTFVTDNQKGSFEGLGLDPAKTHIIGYSHGAHVGGLVCKRVKNGLTKNVKRLSCLDPSTDVLHIGGELTDGNGWNRNVAGLVDVYRTSELCCDGKIYGDFNLHLRRSRSPMRSSRGEPADNVGKLGEIFIFLRRLYQVERQRHAASIDWFVEICDHSFLSAKSFLELDDVLFDGEYSDHEGRWITRRYK